MTGTVLALSHLVLMLSHLRYASVIRSERCRRACWIPEVVGACGSTDARSIATACGCVWIPEDDAAEGSQTVWELPLLGWVYVNA